MHRLLAIAALVLSLGISSAEAAKRVALVIGNDSYKSLPNLNTAVPEILRCGSSTSTKGRVVGSVRVNWLERSEFGPLKTICSETACLGVVIKP